jgi:tetratricopeptide (TPR) repeat protein
MGSWLGWLIVLAAVYLAVVLVRGIIQFVSWFMETFFPEPIEPMRLLEASTERAHETDAAAPPASGRPKKKAGERGSYRKRLLVSAARITLVHWLAAPAQLATRLVSGKRFDYWVRAALTEDDPRKKVTYLSRALALNPGYAPAWGMKADALLTLERYEEALQCFDRVLQMNPGAVAWYEKGLCCARMRRYREAVQCFDKTLAACPDKHSELYEHALQQKQAAEEETHREGAT